jgi:mevalonate kinase
MTIANPGLELTISGKAFLAGEYLALQGGPALVAAVEPRFVLRASPLTQSQALNESPFHEKSQAGILFHKNSNFLKNYRLQFYDPHQGRGGWGGSTAEFALLHSFFKLQKSYFTEANEVIDLRQVWADYREISSSQGQKPSGADLIAQMQGGITLFDRSSGKIDQFAWPFKNLGFLLFRTTNKLPTHEYLKSLAVFSSAKLTLAMDRIMSGLQSVSSSDFVAGITAYSEALDELGFISAQTKSLLQAIQHPNILAKKGCGAMGADVICVFYEKSVQAKFEIIDELTDSDLSFVASDEALAEGLQSNIHPMVHFEKSTEILP